MKKAKIIFEVAVVIGGLLAGAAYVVANLRKRRV
jgi:hypothetical protein